MLTSAVAYRGSDGLSRFQVRALLGEAHVDWTSSSVYLSKKETLGMI
jgi:hypothetical protein